MRPGKKIPLAMAAIAAILAWRSFVALDQSQYGIVTEFGRYVATLREPGLHLKWPYQSVLRFDRRLRLYNPRPSEFLTKDPKNILLDVYVCWRVDDPLVFLQRATDAAGAEARLHDIVWAELAAEVGTRPLSDLVSDKPNEMVAPTIMAGVLGRCRERARPGLGVEIVDVRLRRLNLPEQNKQSVFDRMRAERDRIARQYRAEGEEEAIKIRADADRQKAQLLADAQKEAELKRGEAARKAIEIYAAAHGKDPEFFQFLRSLEAYKKLLNEKTTMVLSSDSELFRYLTDPSARSLDRGGAGAMPPAGGGAAR